MYAGCVAGAIQKETYLDYIKEVGFENITIQKEKPINIPEDILSKYLSKDEIEAFNAGGVGVFSITVFAQKVGGEGESSPQKEVMMLGDVGASCEPGSGCC
jgi:hypothetical protein